MTELDRAVRPATGPSEPAVDGIAGATAAAVGAGTDGGTDGGIDGAVADGGDRYLTFHLGDEVFALPILDITEIIEYRPLTAVPMMPPFVRGVLNLRGRVVPVVDLAARFGRGRTEAERRTGIIIVEARRGEDGDDDHPGQDFGIVVDAVNEVVHVASGQIEPPPAFGAGIRSDFIAGMARRDGDFMVILDVERVLSVDEMIELGRATAGEVEPVGAASR